MKGVRFITAAAAAIAVASALPSVASATDYCVAPNTSCGQNNLDDLQAALNTAAANDDADRVLLGVGTYVGSLTGFTYNSQTAPVEIVGAGRDKTIVTAKAGAIDQVLELFGPAGTSVHDLKIRIPQKADSGIVGLDIRSDASRIEVVENPDQPNWRYGVLMTAPSTLEDSSVTLDPVASSGIKMRNALQAGSPSVVRRSTITAGWAVDSRGGGRVERSRILGGSEGLYASGGVTDVENSVIRYTHPQGHGVYADAAPPGTTVNANGLTVVGVDGKGAGVVAATVSYPTLDARVNLTNSIVRSPRPMWASAAGSGKAEINAAFSDYDSAANETVGGSINETNIQNAGDALFVNPAAGDYRLRVGSPMVDAGDPATATGLDLDGNPLVADGNGDGTARRDIGAFELQPTPAPGPAPDTTAPVISRLRASRSRLRYALSEKARVSVRIQRRLSGRHARYRTLGRLSASARQGTNRTRFSARLRRRDARPGRYRVVITATDTAGNHSARKIASFRVKR